MAKAIVLSLCCGVLLLSGIWQFRNLMGYARVDGRVESVAPYRRTTVAQVIFQGPDGVAHQVQVNAEGRQPGETLPLMFDPARPEETASAYSPILWLIPAILLATPLGLLWLIWRPRP